MTTPRWRGQPVHGAMGPASGNNLPTVAPPGTVGRKGSFSALILPAVRRGRSVGRFVPETVVRAPSIERPRRKSCVTSKLEPN